MIPALLHDEVFLEHDTGPHPESAGRLRAVLARLEEDGALSRLPRLEVAPASRDDLEAVHHPRYLRALEAACAAGGGSLDADTVFSAGSWRAAVAAAGATVRAVEETVRGGADAAFALVRPPGHHAGPARGAGFCLLNNVAVAARAAVRRMGVERVLVVDFDAHHGDGTEAAFREDPSVLYVSTHQWPAYPGTGAGAYVGDGAGRGTTANVALPEGAGDRALALAMDEVVAPLARRFRPGAIVASAGYDAHWTSARHVAGIRMSVTARGFGEVGARLRDLSQETRAPLALALEGGYDPEALGWCVLATLDGIEGRPVRDPVGPAPWPEADARAAVDAAKRAHGL